MAANLTHIAVSTRKIIRFTIYGIVLIMIVRALFGLGRTIYIAVIPPKEEPPTLGFGRIPSISFPEQNQDLPKLEYTFETASGGYPVLAEQADIFFMPRQTSTLFSFDLAKEKANALGYTSDGQKVNETVYRFSSPSGLASMEINIVTGDFSISYNLAADSTPIQELPLSPEQAIQATKSILSTAKSYADDLKEGEYTVSFLKVEGQNLVNALSQSEAELTKVSVFRKAYGDKELPGYTADPTEGNVWFILSGSRDFTTQIIAGEFHEYVIDEEHKETYPLKTAEFAAQELVNGGGYIANLGLNQDGKITIRKIYLAYYDPNLPSQYYQPIIVFEGDRNFYAYVPAVSPDYYGE